MVALLNIGGALYSMLQSLAAAHYYMPCSNAAKTRNQLKFGGVSQTNEMISAAIGQSSPCCGGHLEDILLLNKFFPIVDTCLSCEDIARQSCAMVPIWRFLATFLHPVFPASRVQHISDLDKNIVVCLLPYYIGQTITSNSLRSSNL